MLLAPAFYWLFAETYILFVSSCKSHKKPKLILVQVQNSMSYVFYCKVLVKKLATINYLQAPFYKFCSKYQVFFCLLWVQCSTLLFCYGTFSKKSIIFFFFLAFSYIIFSKNLSTSTFVCFYFFIFFIFSFQLLATNLLAKIFKKKAR